MLSPFPSYDPRNWFWIVGGDDTRAWSSAEGAYVEQYAQDRLTRIGSETELNAVLREHGLIVPAPEDIDYKSAVQALIDATARQRNYDGGVSLAGYATSTTPQWAAEAAAFIAWRDAVWAYVYAQLVAIAAEQRERPRVDELVAELPAIAWPA